MNTTRKRFVVCSLCLAMLFLASGPPLKSYAAAEIANLPRSPDICGPQVPADTGISYAADDFHGVFAYSTQAGVGAQIGLFSYRASSGNYLSNLWPYSPEIGAWLCQSGDILLFMNAYDDSPSWFNVVISEPGWSIITGYSTYSTYEVIASLPLLLYTIDFAGLPSSSTKQYVFRAQDCFHDYVQGTTVCSQWSPPLLLTAASNSYCQDGYVWREAYFFDHVCVQPWERDQAAYDNGQGLARGNSSRDQPNACSEGYVWREAWGGDYTCVDPPQRDQVAYDNSQALNRIIAL